MDTPPPANLLELAIQSTRSGDAEALARALDGGVPVASTTARGDSLLLLAAYHGHEIATIGKATGGVYMGDGQAPLAGVAYKGLTEVATMLLDAGAAIDAAGPDGRTPLMMAAAFDRTEMVRLLLARGARRDARDAAGLDAASIAHAMGAPKAEAILRE